MCNCVQKSRTPLAQGKGFHYKFECSDKDGKLKAIELDASNDGVAKQLAELECSEGLKTLSFAETEKVIGHPGLGKINFEISDTANSNRTLEGSIVTLNPKSWTRLAQYGNGGCSIRMAGKWIPGIGHPAWGPNGSSNETLNGCNKWCVLIQIWAGNDIIGTIPWTHAKNGQMTIGYFGFPTAVIAFMNDDADLYGDNENDFADPMRADVTLF